MILFFDNFITNKTLGTHYEDLDAIRKTNTIYKKNSKKNICAYSLYSYSKIKFKCSLINLKAKKKDFNFIKNICRKNFKNKIIINNFRSEDYKYFKNSLNIIKKYKKNKWVFVVGNIDHPLITSNINYVYESIAFANKFLKKNDYVSIACSHQPENLNMANKNFVLPNLMRFPYNKIYENKNFIVLKLNRGHSAHTFALQIMSVKMLEKLIDSTNFGEKKIFRTDEMNGLAIKEHIMIVPKNKICDHYDGYSHTKLFGCYLSTSKYPPLFMPKRFFKEKFNIYYGFNNIRKNGININPLAKKFSFEDPKNGTDLKIELSKIPYFWKDRIKNIIKNNKISDKELSLKAKYIEKEINNPYKKKNIYVIKLYIKYFNFRRRLQNILFNIKKNLVIIKSFFFNEMRNSQKLRKLI